MAAISKLIIFDCMVNKNRQFSPLKVGRFHLFIYLNVQTTTITRAGENSTGVPILLLWGMGNTIIRRPWAAWAILLKSKLGAIVLHYYFTQP